MVIVTVGVAVLASGAIADAVLCYGDYESAIYPYSNILVWFGVETRVGIHGSQAEYFASALLKITYSFGGASASLVRS